MNLDVLHANDKPGEYPPSWYAASAELLPRQPALEGNQRADICVIGAGYTGLSAALHLAESGHDVIVLDAHRIGWGASGRNGGQVSTGQRRPQDELESQLGADTAHRLWEMALDARNLVRQLCQTHGIDCDIRPGIIEADHRARFVPDSRAYVRKLNEEYGYSDARFLDREEMRALVDSPAYYGGGYDRGAFHLHPLKYVLGLARAAQKAGVRIFEQSQVDEISEAGRARIITAKGMVDAEHYILACNGYLGRLEAKIASSVMPINNFIVVTEPLGEERAASLIANNAAVSDSRFVVNYFRLSPDHRLIFGGGESYGYRFPADIRALVRRPMLEVYPQLEDVPLEYGWGGTLAITMQRMPYLRRAGKHGWAAAGYSGHGISMATFSGKVLAQVIADEGKAFDLLAKLPMPPFPGGTGFRAPLLALAMTWYALRDRF